MKPDGFALVSSPDLESIASLILDSDLNKVAYTSLAGPITPLEMLFGQSASITRGHMAHKNGFTCASLGRHFIEAGFPIVLVKRQQLDLWALGLMQEADQAYIQGKLLAAGLDLSEETD